MKFYSQHTKKKESSIIPCQTFSFIIVPQMWRRVFFLDHFIPLRKSGGDHISRTYRSIFSALRGGYVLYINASFIYSSDIDLVSL